MATMAGYKTSYPQTADKYTWAIGGGKGGTGKSFLATSLGIQLTRLGRRTVLIDTDLGGANLHTFLGVKAPKITIADFISRNVSSLTELAVETSVEGLHLISAARDVFEIANPSFQQKERLIRHIKKLPYEFIVIDVGGGSDFNVVDFFLCADTGITLANPEPTSIENAYRFLKSALLRKLYRTAHGRHFKETIRGALSGADGKEVKTIQDFIQQVKPYNGVVAERLEFALKRFRPILILNQSRSEEDVQLGYSIEDIARRYLGVDLDFLGAIPYDDRVHFSVRRFKPLLTEYPASHAASSIETITNALLAKTEAASPKEKAHSEKQ
jgi:flagellar biosynthesis protein FlhG